MTDASAQARSPAQSLPAAERILIVRPSALGDVARSVPVLASLRAAYPHARIDWLVRDAFAPVIAAHPALSTVVPFPRRELSRWLRTLQWGRVRGYVRTLRDPRYDLVLDCQGLARSALMARITGAPVRAGYRDARELGWLPMTHRVRTPSIIHTVDKALALLEHLGIPALRTPEACRLYSSPADQAWRRSQPFADRRYAVLAPTSAWPAKQWPADRFAALAAFLTQQGVACVITGAAQERPQVQPLLDLARRTPLVIDRMGETSVGQLMAVIEGSALTVANDSAALHIAVGFARPIVALLGPTNPALACPYAREHDVLQHVREGDEFYFRDARSAGMMARITTDEVIARARTLLDL